MSGFDVPRHVNRGLGSALRTARYDVAFAYLGTGFALTDAGRLFVPLVGRLRMVPSPQEEMRWAASWPRWWHAAVLIFAFILFAGASVNGHTLRDSWIGALLFPVGVIAVLLLWVWREHAVIARWDYLEGTGPDRTALVVSFMSDWSTLRLLTLLVAQGLFLAIVMKPWTLLRWPLVPSANEIGGVEWLQRSFAALLLVAFLLVHLRACYWAVRALVNRSPVSASR